jgi:hypothetical protein
VQNGKHDVDAVKALAGSEGERPLRLAPNAIAADIDQTHAVSG